LEQDTLKEEGGLNVKFVISKNPLGVSVAERAIPCIVFEDKDQKKRERYLKKWLRNSNMKQENNDFDIRKILDWDYYKERLGGTIQKIITIPAALQNCVNPIKAIKQPEWLNKRIKANNDKFKQKDMKHFFQVTEKPKNIEIEDLQTMGVLNEMKALSMQEQKQKKLEMQTQREKYSKMENCPKPAEKFGEWMKYQKQNWRKIRKNMKENKEVVSMKELQKPKSSLGQFIRNMDEVLLKSTWHIISIQQSAADSGIMKVWVQNDQSNMFAVKVRMPRIIYINSKNENKDSEFKKVNSKILPRNRKVFNLYEWETTEENYQEKFQ
jgi:DNA polymerase epsilon subunit 1